MTADLLRAPVTATMSRWLVVEAYDEDCLFGFAEIHPRTGGLSWLLSTPIIELSEEVCRARTRSGRVYQLGRKMSAPELDDEGRTALRLLLNRDDCPGRAQDTAWVTAQKVARHLALVPPPRSNPAEVERFHMSYRDTYLATLAIRRTEA